ncbi:MAG: nucleotide exchange factor GrpE [Ruminococcus sp.]
MKNKELDELMKDDPAAAEENTAETEEVSAEDAAEECAAEESSELDTLKDALSKAEEALESGKDQHLRLMAEYQNYRNRTAEEKKKIYGDAKADCIKELLNVADTFDRAVAAECSDETYKKGVELTYSQLQKAFEKLGITEVDPLGEDFDPNLHNAIRQVEEGDFEENKVCEVYQKGYTLGDRLIRPAVVAVKA